MTQRHFRKSIRLREYDYGQPWNYFITICTIHRTCFLGDIRGCDVQLSAIGEIVEAAWHTIPEHYPMVQLDEMVIMPNHVHGILCIRADEDGMPLDLDLSGAQDVSLADRSGARKGKGPGKGTLGSIIGSFKSASSRNINKYRGTTGAPVWQTNYYEHVIRDEQSLDRIRAYIAGNPARWEDDDDNPYPR